MKKNVITISREFGSGGGMIGKMVAEQRVTNSRLYNIALGASYGYALSHLYEWGMGQPQELRYDA